MSVTRFRLRGVPEGRLDLSVLTPQRLAGLDEAAVGRLVLAAGRGAPSVGDLFAMSAGEADAVVIEGGSALLDRVGAGMEGGSLVLEGDAGDLAGRGMTGGRLELRGSAGRLAASGLRGGVVEIAGDAGALLAGPMPGERAGMDGGVVLVRGSAGAQAGDRLRRGLVVVEGDAGEHAGSRMVAGTLVVCGRVGASPGALLRRGTVVLGHAIPAPDGFLPSGRTPGVFQRLLAASLRAHSPAAAEAAARAGLRLLGDQAALGKGEMLLPG
ncbi:MAG: formylmethanofuran dehydrogenase subunit C [Janthinobacterium lividum]